MSSSRNTSVNVVVLTITDTPVTLLGPSPRRKSIILSSAEKDYTVSMNPRVKDKVGMLFVAGMGWIQTITDCDVGSAIKQPWYAVAATGETVEIEVTEILEDEVQEVGGQEPPYSTIYGDFQQIR